MNEDPKHASSSDAIKVKPGDTETGGRHGFAATNHEKPHPQPTPQPGTAMQPAASSAKYGRYSGFFLVMLLLATLVAFFSLFGSLFSILFAVGFISGGEPLVGIATAMNPIINLLSLVALGLLYFKKSAGLYLKFMVLFLAVLLAGVSSYLGANSESFKNGISESSYQETANSEYPLTAEERKIEQSINDFFIGSSAPIIFGSVALFVSLVWNSGAAMLWFFAWRSQKKHDAIVNTAK